MKKEKKIIQFQLGQLMYGIQEFYCLYDNGELLKWGIQSKIDISNYINSKPTSVQVGWNKIV